MVCSTSLAVSGSQSEPRGSGVLLASKFHPPDPRREWVPRQRLVHRLAADDAKLALVHAPAGFGKTIAVAQWRAAGIPGQAFAWVSLDPGDDDPVRLWSHIVSSLERVCPNLAGQDLLSLLRVQAPDIPGRLVPALVDALAGLGEQVVLVLDDFHLVRARRCHEQIESLLTSLLPPAKIVIISRTVPPLQVARLRAAGEMTEIGMRELRFKPEEAAGLIGAVAGSPLSQGDLEELVERTEGWPAALYLAALSLRSQPDPGAFVHEFIRGNRYVADYLLEEVISRQPEHVVRFLTGTAILDRFTAELCDAVMARTDSAEIIDMLERENLFLVALDESRRWFRYHHLLSQALRARRASNGSALTPLLHRRASGWFRAHGSPEEAIGHALAAGDTDVAVEVMAAHWYSYVNVGRMETVSGWLKAVGDHTITGSPLAAHTAAWIAALSGESGTVQRLLPVIEAGDGGGPLPDGMRSLRSSAALLRATFGFDGIRVMRESAVTAVALEDDPASPWHVLALAVHGFSLYLSGEPGSAQELRRAVLSGVADPVIRLASTSIAALVAIAEGRLAEGEALADAALSIADDGLRNAPQASLAHMAVASGWAAEGRLEEARRELVRALQSRQRLLGMSPWPTLEIMFELAAVLHGMGDDAGAATLVGEIDDVLAALPDGAEAQRARLELLSQRLGVGLGAEPTREGLELGLTDREMAVLRMLRGTMSVAEIAQELGLSPNTIKTHIRAIYRKLGVCARPAAVTRARELGLLLTHGLFEVVEPRDLGQRDLLHTISTVSAADLHPAPVSLNRYRASRERHRFVSLGGIVMTQTATEGIRELRAVLEGPVLAPGDPGFDNARRVWNAGIDRSPAMIARCAATADVAAALDFARGRRLKVAVRGGAHNPAGTAVCDDGLMIDLSPLNGVAVDPAARRARVGGGALLADLDAATQAHGLAVPAGLISHTGVGGLTLGGGMGWLTRKYGLSIDNLVAAEVVTADGRIVRASADEHPDLFWAIRGGGGNFGVVTAFEFALHELDPMVEFGLFFWGLDQGPEALRLAREITTAMPPDINAVPGAVNAPPAPFVPQQYHFAPGYALLLTGFDATPEHARLTAQIRETLPPLFDVVTPMPYVELQKLLDGANAWGNYAYEKGTYIEDLSDPVIGVLTEHVPRKSSPMSTLLFYRLDGAYCRAGDDETAFSGGRTSRYATFIVGFAPDAKLLATDRGWARDTWEALRPHAIGTGDGYINGMTDTSADRVRRSYGPAKYERLSRIKAEYDPGNLFRSTANIQPA